MSARVFGSIPGVPLGAAFPDRGALRDAGVHRPLQAGISGAADEGADSVVVSAGYEDDEDHGDTIIYTGHGGNDPATGKQMADQDLVAGNQALVASHERGYPVRVIRGHQGSPDYAPSSGYRYDGLYDVTRYWAEDGSSGFRVFRFELVKRQDQGDPRSERTKTTESATSLSSHGAQASLRGNQPSSDSDVAGHIDDVAAALDLVAEATSVVGADVGRSLRDSTDAGDFGRARELLELAERLSAFRSTAEDASKEWSRISGSLAKGKRRRSRRPTSRSGSGIIPTRKDVKRKRADYGKVSPDQKTSQREFRLPILEVLVDMGGSGSVSDVLRELEQQMRPTFMPADLEPLPSNPRELRWRNTAQWTRQELVNEGLIGPPRQRGLWEITESGREFLRASRPSGR